MKTEKEKMLSGENYFANDSQLVAERVYVREQLEQFNKSLVPFTDNYYEYLNKVLPNAHKSVWIQTPFHCDYGYNVYCEENVFMNFDCMLLDVAPIRIGRNTLLAPKVQIYTAGHAMDAVERVAGVEYGRPVTIGRDCWIGGGVVICPGVSIGDRCVVGAGSVVTKDMPDDSVWAGNPAAPLKKYTK